FFKMIQSRAVYTHIPSTSLFRSHEVPLGGLELDDLLPRARPGRLDVPRDGQRPGSEVDRGERLPRHPEPVDHRAHARDVFEVQRSEEHTSELQSRENLVCRLLLE